MNIKAVEDEANTTEDVELECSNCGYTRVVKVARGKLVVQDTCPNCLINTLSKKGRSNPTIHHQKDL